MNKHEKGLYEALAKTTGVASAAVNGDAFPDDAYDESPVPEDISPVGELVCTPKTLPARLLVKAAETAKKINPTNAPVLGPLAAVAEGFQIADPLRIAVVTSKYWGPTPRQLTVSFMETTPADLKARIISQHECVDQDSVYLVRRDERDWGHPHLPRPGWLLFLPRNGRLAHPKESPDHEPPGVHHEYPRVGV